MYIPPEISRTIATQRNQDIQAKAEAFRQIAEARAGRPSDRPRTARYRWFRRATVRRPEVVYSSPRNA